MPLTTENARRLLEQDHDVTEVTQGGNAMGHYLEARLTDGRAVQIDFHDNPAWKDTDRLAGRIEVSYANRPQAEWQYDDNDMADREHTVIDPADPAAGKTLAKAVEGWERAGGLHTARAAGTSHLAANQPPEEYAYRWRKPGDPDRHIAYLSTAFDRDQAMKAREDAGYVVTKVDEDPAVLYEQHRKASCMRASHILERYESPTRTQSESSTASWARSTRTTPRTTSPPTSPTHPTRRSRSPETASPPRTSRRNARWADGTRERTRSCASTRRATGRASPNNRPTRSSGTTAMRSSPARHTTVNCPRGRSTSLTS